VKDKIDKAFTNSPICKGLKLIKLYYRASAGLLPARAIIRA